MTDVERLPSAHADLTVILIHGGLNENACDNHAHAASINRAWERRAHESVDQFRQRAEDEADSLGAKLLIFGGFPNVTLDTEKEALAQCQTS